MARSSRQRRVSASEVPLEEPRVVVSVALAWPPRVVLVLGADRRLLETVAGGTELPSVPALR